MICISCATSGCNGAPCQRLERLLEPEPVLHGEGLSEDQLTGPVRLMGSSGLCSWDRVRVTVAEIERGMPSRFDFPYLKKSDNTLLNDFYVDGLTYNAIARKRKIKQNSVGPRLSRIRAKIARTSLICRTTKQEAST
jgi:hypothetical protein